MEIKELKKIADPLQNYLKKNDIKMIVWKFQILKPPQWESYFYGTYTQEFIKSVTWKNPTFSNYAATMQTVLSYPTFETTCDCTFRFFQNKHF